MNQYTKWVACWGNATSIIDHKECVYSKDITLRYPVFMCFDGSKLRLRFSNLTGVEPVHLTSRADSAETKFLSIATAVAMSK